MTIVCNWKMNGSLKLCDEYLNYIQPNINIIICPPIIFALKLINKFIIGAQDCSRFKKGQYTGDISCEILQNVGIQYVIVGHSERINLYNENIQHIIDKIERCLENNLIPIVCIANDILNIMKKLQQFSNKIYIAYEPIQSIGSGIIPSDEEIYNTLFTIKSFGKFKTFYGGSVNIENIAIFTKLSIVDGLLLGGSSLNINDLQKIINTYNYKLH